MLSLDHLELSLQSAAMRPTLDLLYGSGQPADAAVRRWLHLAGLFSGRFPQHRQVSLFSTPGRTEVGGNHTDHQHGRVLCAAVDLDMIALAAPNDDHIIRLQSEGFDHADIIDLNQLEPVPAEQGHSASLIRGIAAAFAQRGRRLGGFDAYTTSRVPKGSGLSSSAAFEILVATILDELWNGGSFTPVERAIIAQYAENHYFGKPCGLMDQCGCSVGGFIAIDFANPADPVVEPVDFDFAAAGHTLVITNTGGSHADLTQDYASIPRDMKKVAQLLGGKVLRDIPEHAFWDMLPNLRRQLDDLSLLRAMHFFQDHNRVKEQADALRHGQFSRFLDLVRASGYSSRSQLQNVYSTQNVLEQPVSLGLSLSGHVLAGRGAVRVHGGGFAGTIQAFVPHDLTDAYLAAMRRIFGDDAATPMRVRPVGSVVLDQISGI